MTALIEFSLRGHTIAACDRFARFRLHVGEHQVARSTCSLRHRTMMPGGTSQNKKAEMEIGEIPSKVRVKLREVGIDR